MIQLLTLDTNTVVNPQFITQITIVNLNTVRRERHQNHQTSEQRARIENKYWEVSVYLRSEDTNPQRYTQCFETKQAADAWVKQKFGAVIVNKL